MALIDNLLANPELINQIIVCANKSPSRYQAFDDAHSIFVCSKSMSLPSASAYALDSVFWDERNITVCQSNNDVISFNFSGCLMAKTPLTGGNLIFHINCLNPGHPYDRRYDFAKYLLDNNIPCSDLTLFQPICDDWLHKKAFLRDNVKRYVWGLITMDNKCYSLIVDFNHSSSQYKLHSIWLHERSSNNVAVYNAMTDFCRTTKTNVLPSVYANLKSVLGEQRKVLIKCFENE